jgi:hypothetical protein
LFLINNKNTLNEKKNIKNNSKFNIINIFNLINLNEYKSISNLLFGLNLLNNLNKNIFIYNKNFIIIICKNKFKNTLIYKFNNIELPQIFKLYMYTNSDIFINTSDLFIKFKSEHERYLNVLFDCFHNNLPRFKVKNMSVKMLILCLYILL